MTNKKILYWLRKAQWVTAQIRTDVDDDDDDDDDGKYLTTACYTMEDLEKGLWRYEINYTGSHYSPVVGVCDQWWTCCKNIIQHRVIKHSVGSGSSQSAHVPLIL